MNNYAFIDSQNLHLSIKELGWELDYKKFRIYLKNKFRVKKAYLFLGYLSKHKNLYAFLRNAGFILIFKPILEERGLIKGNCDAELVLHCVDLQAHFDKAVIVSGDGDFYCLVEYLVKKDKFLKLLIPNKQKYSRLRVIPFLMRWLVKW